MRSASAYWVVQTGRGEIREHSLPRPAAGELLVRAEYGALSRGTEALVHAGRVPPSEFQRMRCPHQEGEFPAPVKYGYINVGRVEDGDEAWIGRRVFCLYPHQTYYVVPAGAVVELPKRLPSERAVLAANMETALNAVWDANPRLGDRITVVGAGCVGSLVAYLVGRGFAAQVELVDLNPERRAIAQRFGVEFASPADATPDRDLVFHASGSPEGLRMAMALAGKDATVLELSWYGNQLVPLELGSAFHVHRLQLKSSQVGTVSPNARRRFDYGARLALALDLCVDDALDVLISGESRFWDLPQIAQEVLGQNGGALCHRLRYDAAP